MTEKLYDSFSKSRDTFLNIHGAKWLKHVHPADRDEICGYMMRMVQDNANKLFNVWNVTIKRPKDVEKIDNSIKTIIRCVDSDRSYIVEILPEINVEAA